jgi:hypothetical protein
MLRESLTSDQAVDPFVASRRPRLHLKDRVPRFPQRGAVLRAVLMPFFNCASVRGILTAPPEPRRCLPPALANLAAVSPLRAPRASNVRGSIRRPLHPGMRTRFSRRVDVSRDAPLEDRSAVMTICY